METINTEAGATQAQALGTPNGNRPTSLLDLKAEALAWAVAVVTGRTVLTKNPLGVRNQDGSVEIFRPHTDPAQFEPLVDGFKISTKIGHSGQWIAWCAYNLSDEERFMAVGESRQEAVLRTLLLMHGYDRVYLPAELTDGA